MRDDKQKKHREKVKELHKQYPDVPTEIFDIEASDEMAAIYYEEFGY